MKINLFVFFVVYLFLGSCAKENKDAQNKFDILCKDAGISVFERIRLSDDYLVPNHYDKKKISVIYQLGDDVYISEEKLRNSYDYELFSSNSSNFLRVFLRSIPM